MQCTMGALAQQIPFDVLVVVVISIVSGGISVVLMDRRTVGIYPLQCLTFPTDLNIPPRL
jgi:hypothetical protein